MTSRTDSMDEVNGILKGGDDYITKPYQAPVLLARIGAVLKRANGGRIKETTQFFHKGVSWISPDARWLMERSSGI